MCIRVRKHEASERIRGLHGCVCGQSLGEVRVPHRGNVVEKVIEGAYEVVGVFDRIEEKRDAMQSLVLPPPARQALAQAARSPGKRRP